MLSDLDDNHIQSFKTYAKETLSKLETLFQDNFFFAHRKEEKIYFRPETLSKEIHFPY